MDRVDLHIARMKTLPITGNVKKARKQDRACTKGEREQENECEQKTRHLGNGDQSDCKFIFKLVVKQALRQHLWGRWWERRERQTGGFHYTAFLCSKIHFTFHLFMHIYDRGLGRGRTRHFWRLRSSTCNVLQQLWCWSSVETNKTTVIGKRTRFVLSLQVLWNNDVPWAGVTHSPVTWSTRIREVMMRPYWEKSCSSSFCVMVLGKPLTYRLASRMEAELGRA